LRAITKDFTREIKNTKSRFISILVLVALAVAFLSGLQATAPDMKLTGHNYLEGQGLADVQIMSTVGLTDEDLAEIQKDERVRDAEATYVIDAFTASETTDKITKVYALPKTEINSLVLREGRMPEKIDECVVEEKALAALNISIGDKVKLTPQESFEDALVVNEFTVVGTIRNPIYVSVERGSSSIGTGSVAIYMSIPKEAFDSEIYTTIYLRLNKDPDMISFYEDYNDAVDDFVDSIEDFGNTRANVRYNALMKKVDDAQLELDDARAEADEKLGDADRKLKDANRKIQNGKKEIADADIQILDAEQQISDAAIKIADAEKEIADGEKELADAKTELDDGEKEYEDGRKKWLNARAEWYWGAEQLSQGSQQLDAGQAQLDTYMAGFNSFADGVKSDPSSCYVLGLSGTESTSEVMSTLAALSDGPVKDGFNTQLGTMNDQDGNPYTVDSFVAAFNQLQAQQAQINSGRSSIASGQDSLNAGWWELVDAEKKLQDARKELDEGWEEYNDGLAELEEGKQKLEDGKADLEKGKLDLEDAKLQLADAKKTLAKGEQDYQNGLKEYQDAKEDTDKKIEDAQIKINDARADLEDITEVKWYVFGRGYNPGYTGLGQDADRMGNLARVFPIIFFLVAALVCLTTMTRMVEEQRIQIGGMKALGYSTFDISKKYIGYGLIPSLLGSVIGLAVGYTLFPTMIFTAYQIMYQMPNIEIHQYISTSVACIVAAVACTTLSTLAACLKTLKETPANLMRPKTPQAGKRVFLEYIGFIWKKLKFIHKVTARNLFRYQKRFWMTVIGIGGCTALIIVGFGVRYSLTYTMYRQYDELTHYDAQISVEKGIKDEEMALIEEFINGDKRITQHSYLHLGAMNAVSDTRTQSIYLYAIDSEEIPKYSDLYDYKTGERLTVEDGGVYIDQKLSELLNVDVGDRIFLDGDSKAYAKVAGIFEHYTGHFCYMTPAYYEEIFKEECKHTGAFLQFEDDSEESCNAIFEDIMNFSGVAGTSRMLDVKDTYLTSMERIDFVVVIIILSAGALALVVLYNLSNINITERIRELATIKVLGFYDREVSAYVYRENIFLTIFGIIAGTFMGHYLHTWLIKSVEIDLMMFGRETNPMSYLWAAVLTGVFAVIANLMAHFKMKKIDMVESLKSAE